MATNHRIENLKRRTRFESYEERLAMSAQPLGDVLVPLDGRIEQHYDERVSLPAAAADNFAGDFTGDRLDDTLWGLDEELSQLLNDSSSVTGLDAVRNAYGFDGSGQTVAIIDSGIAYDHVALGGGLGGNYRVVGGWDFAENDANPYDDGPAGFHGTHVAGIVGSSDARYRGVASGVDLVALRVFDDQGAGYFQWTEQALRWVHEHRHDFENPITTVNLSLGASWNGNAPPSWAMLEDEFAQLEADGIFISVSAGNSFTTYNSAGLSYPAASSYVVPVSSVDNDGALSYFSQRNSRVIAAPGRSITSTVPDYVFGADGIKNDFAAASGTSMAAPYVAGAAALAREAMEFVGYAGITQDTIYNHFRDTADVIYDSVTNANYFRLNLQRAIDSLMPADDFGNTAATAHSLGDLAGSLSVNGTLGRSNDVDHFTFTAAESGTVHLRVVGHDSLQPRLTIGNDTGGAPSEASFEVTAGQQYSFSVGTSGDIGHFTATLELQSRGESADSVVKSYVRSDGTVYTLTCDGWLRVNGRCVWSDTSDVHLAEDGTLYWQGTNGLLQRLAGGTWETLADNAVKFAVHNDGTTFVLGRDGWLSVNGRQVWSGTRDMHLSADGTLYWQGTNGLLQVRAPGGNWETLHTDVVKFAVSANGALYALETDGWLHRNGRQVWSGTRDMHLASDGTLYWQGTNGLLQRLGTEGGWQTLDTDVVSFAARADGSLIVLDAQGSLSLDGRHFRSDTRSFQLNRDGTLYWLGRNGQFQARDLSGVWQTIANDISKFCANDGGPLYALGTDGWLSVNGRRIWAETKDMQLTCDGTLYWHGTNGLLQRLPKGGVWETLDSEVSTFAAQHVGAVSWLTQDGTLKVNGTVRATNVRELAGYGIGPLVIAAIDQEAQASGGYALAPASLRSDGRTEMTALDSIYSQFGQV